jgi:hypothetical protein
LKHCLSWGGVLGQIPLFSFRLTTLELTCADFALFAMRASRATASGSTPG